MSFLRISKIFLYIFFLCISSSVICFPQWAGGTVEFTCETEKSCNFCHENPDGGGTLTTKGEQFMEAGYVLNKDIAPSPWKRHLQFFLGFVHILAAIIWFGAIFYIHLFVKPTSFTSGLPKRERILGWVCILAVVSTGVVLTVFRIRAVQDLWTTTFGIIWMVKVAIFVIMVAVASVVTITLHRRIREAHTGTEGDVLLNADGREGRPARFVFEGRLYDATESKLWKNGVHMGRHYTGSDLTSAMADAPHGTEVLDRVKHIGTAPAPEKAKGKAAFRAFVILAYFILLCMLGVIFCVAYWHWGPSLVAHQPG